MDSPLIFIVIIGAVIVLAIFLPRWVRRSTRAAGDREERRFTEARLAHILDDLGATIVVNASEAVTREIVDTVVLQQPRKFSILPDGGYGIRFVEPDDAVARLVADDDGTRLQIECFSEYLGMPNTSEFWMELRTRVTSGAETRDVRTSVGPALRHTRDDARGTWALG